MKPDLILSQIYIYPIKSLGGISLNEATVEPRGLQHDRRWMLVDENNQFLTQRKFPEMALLQVSLLPNGLQVSHKTKSLVPLFISFEPATNNQYQVTVWEDVCTAIEVSPEANQWFTEALGKICRLVYMPETSQRQVDPDYAQPGDIVSFADGFPLLIIGQESLNDLNQRLTEPIPMNRFRPSLVFTGGLPYAEDTWNDFTIGLSRFKGVKPCGRCVLTTIDQQNAQKSPEPLRTLATYRSAGSKILFGQNVLPLSPGNLISVGDTIKVESFGN